ncbi:DUF2235 domain-containing protein [Rhodanobacter sp. Si-c]|uniref:DUF2235 domain-containing protein n=1 Tax=Rhodanobacter lycopersici TaxID=3162487 RepID=A0ABV3QCT9_9GAMM
MSKRRLVVLIDGTWSRPESNTNVERLRRLIAPSDAAGIEQLVHYVTGVGEVPGLAYLLGGAFGYGLSGNVKDGYRWLCGQWRPGDEIWLFGFSRGAYAARSLGGLLRKCGLLRRDGNAVITSAAVAMAYAFYRDTAIKPGDDAAMTWRATHSLETDIHFIGVWDTVGALGIPYTAAWFPFARAHYRFHDTDLSRIVKHAYQALALDEHRAAFAPCKWMRNPATLAPGESPTAKKPEQIEVEQRWFVGSHADVGGGNGHDATGHHPDPLPDLPLAWLQHKAMAAGLACNEVYVPPPDAAAGVPRDSYAEFMLGIYKTFRPPFDRVIGNGVNETVDESVWRHARLVAGYLSPTLARALRDDVIAAPPGVA